MANYSTEELRQVQMILDTADPFITEALYSKTEEQLMEQLERLNRELEVIPAKNEEWRKRHIKFIKTVEAMYMMRVINKGDPKGGLVIV